MKTGGKPELAAVLDSISEADFRRLPGAEAFEISATTTPDSQWLRHALAGAHAVWSSLRLPLTGDLLAAAGPALRVVLTNSTGTDHLDLAALRRRGVEVISLKHDQDFLRQITPTAELAFGLLLACARRLPECVAATRQGDWARHRLGGQQLSGKTLGIIGVGRLGSMMAQYGAAFRMRLLGCDPRQPHLPAGMVRADLAALLREADMISLHVHLDDGTRGLLGRREFECMKPGMILVNTSRGGLIDEAALIDAMERGIVLSAGLDVIDGEWLEDKSAHALICYSRRNPRLLITPHVGGTCPETVLQTAAHSMRKLADFFQAGVDADGGSSAAGTTR